MRVAWATSPAPLFTMWPVRPSMPQTLPLAAIARPCAIRHSGTTQRLVCVDSTNTATDYAIAVTNGAASLAASGTQAAPTGTVALVSVPNSNGDLDAYAVDNNGDLAALFGAPAPTNGGTAKCLATRCIDDAMVVPACDGIPGGIVLHATSGLDELRLVDFSGTYTPVNPGNPFGAGKILRRGLDRAARRLGLADAGASDGQQHRGPRHQRGRVDSTCATRAGARPIRSGAAAEGMRGSTIGFIGGTEPRLIAESVDATGVVLIELILSSTTA